MNRDRYIFWVKLFGFIALAAVVILSAITFWHYYDTSKTEKNTFDEKSVAVSVPAAAFSGDNRETVYYVTDGGEKYHVSDCRFIKSAKNVYTISENTSKYGGYSPCTVCIK